MYEKETSIIRTGGTNRADRAGRSGSVRRTARRSKADTVSANESGVPDDTTDVFYSMPATRAIRSRVKEKSNRPVTVEEVLRDNFNKNFRDSIECYAEIFPEKVCVAIGNEATNEIKKIKVIRATVVDTKSYMTKDLHKTEVYLRVRAILEVVYTRYEHCEPQDDTGEEAQGACQSKTILRSADFIMRYLMDLRPCEQTCKGPDIRLLASDKEWAKLTDFGILTTDKYLMMATEDDNHYSIISSWILKIFYPEALKGPCRIDAEELVRRMGLPLVRLRLGSFNGIKGRAIFNTITVKAFDNVGRCFNVYLKPGTILINTDLCRNEEDERATIIHECIHMHLERPFFFLQIISGKNDLCYSSRMVRGRTYRELGPMARSERRTEKISTSMIMQGDNTKLIVDNTLAEHGGKRTPENLDLAMKNVASAFGTSKSMAKYRMIELGYQEAEGIYNFVDNKFCPDHGCAGEWKRGVTYIISIDDAIRLAEKSDKFYQEVTFGRYVYVEGHFCVNSPRYVITKGARAPRLTVYARHHIDECCIAFRFCGREWRFDDFPFDGASECRKKPIDEGYLNRFNFVAEPGTAFWVKENDDFLYGADIWGDLLGKMTGEFKTSLSVILDAVGVTADGLADMLGVDRRTVFRWCSENSVSLRQVTAICVALSLPPNVGMRLADTCTSRSRKVRENKIHTFMISYADELTLERCNSMLRSRELEPLTTE